MLGFAALHGFLYDQLIIIFTLFYIFQRSVVPLVKPHNFVHPDDHLVLEDESGRVKLSGSVISPSTFVTGSMGQFFEF